MIVRMFNNGINHMINRSGASAHTIIHIRNIIMVSKHNNIPVNDINIRKGIIKINNINNRNKIINNIHNMINNHINISASMNIKYMIKPHIHIRMMIIIHTCINIMEMHKINNIINNIININNIKHNNKMNKKLENNIKMIIIININNIPAYTQNGQKKAGHRRKQK